MRAVVNLSREFSEISRWNSDKFAEEMLKIEESGIDEIILDLAGVSSLTSMAIGSIYSAFERLSSEGRKLTVVNPNERIKKLLTITGVKGLLEGN